LKLQELRPAEGSKTLPFRKGRGHATGNGKTAGRGHKGQNARAGGGVRPGFEGGQMPLYRRVPKRGFNNKRFAKQFTEVNISALEQFENGTIVDEKILLDKGLVRKVLDGVVILGKGELTKKITVQATRFSKSAKEKIEAVGGKVEVI